MEISTYNYYYHQNLKKKLLLLIEKLLILSKKLIKFGINLLNYTNLLNLISI